MRDDDLIERAKRRAITIFASIKTLDRYCKTMNMRITVKRGWLTGVRRESCGVEI